MHDVRPRTRDNVRPRRATPEDAAAVQRMVLRCSPASLYRRFLTVVPPDTAASMVATSLESGSVATWLAEVDREVVGIGATHMFRDGPAELSLLVEDGWQRRGVATALIPDLIEDARARHASHLWMTALGETLPIIRKLTERCALSLQVSLSGGIAEITADLPARRSAQTVSVASSPTGA